jgi:hypothetical protein
VRPETVPLVVVALLLLSVQPGVESFTTVVGGDRDLEGGDDAVLLVDGTLSLPAGAERNTSLYVLDGTARIDGTLDGDVVQLAGNVSVGPDASVTGGYDAYGGTRTVAEGADVRVDAVVEPLATERSPAERVGLFVLQAVVLGVVAFLGGRRYPDLFANVGHSVREHPVVSATVGLLSTVTLLALFVFMAFTLVLLPVTVLGLVGGVVVLAYAYVSVGFLVGSYLDADRPGVATAAGAVGFLAASELLGVVPVVGGLVPVVVVLTAVGAVVITYFGLREFHPPALGPVEEG